MNSTDNNSHIDKLHGLLDGVKAKANDLRDRGRLLVVISQEAEDVAECAKQFIDAVSSPATLPSECLNSQISAWQDWHARADDMALSLQGIKGYSMATDATTISTSGLMTADVIRCIAPEPCPSINIAKENFELFLERADLLSDIEIEIKRLQLDETAFGQKSPLALVRDANQAFRLPSSESPTPAAVLIPLREAINGLLSALLRRRPQQVRASKPYDKVLSLCTQVGRGEITSEYSELLGRQAETINNSLSGSKQADMTRDTLREELNHGLAFIRSFLRAIDEAKLKRLST